MNAQSSTSNWRIVLRAWLPMLCVLGWLWFRLLDHLRVEWTVNTQYSYGWAVPFLCLYLIGRHLEADKADELRDEKKTTLRPDFSIFHPPSSILYSLVGVCALLYAPTRLVQEANPEWRLVSWALALEVVGITLAWLALGGGGRRTEDGGWRIEDSGQEPKSRLRFFALKSAFAFPVLFFLVAVPWPTPIEGPLIQGLTRANAATTVELLNLVGIPSIQHGNTIEVGTGVVGIDEACSGIRSFQATLMISLFLGALYRLSGPCRAGLCLLGFGLSFVFNVARTMLLSWVAARQGIGAVGKWHDPAGVIILVRCFVCLWLIALGLAAKKRKRRKDSTEQNPESGVSTLNSQLSTPRKLALALLSWLIIVEVGTEVWYRSHEWRLPRAVAWHVELPRKNATFYHLPFSEKTKQFLRYDEGLNGAWQEADGTGWQAIFLRWNPGRIAVHLAKSHTPEVCLTAAGRELVSQSELRLISVHGLQLPFLAYVMKGNRGPTHVFYCLWEDRAEAQSFRTMGLTYANRLGPVLAGRRNCGQRSLEVAISGIEDAAQAEAALARQLEWLIKVE